MHMKEQNIVVLFNMEVNS